MTFKLKHKNEDFPYRSLSVVASNSAKADRDADNEEVNDAETERINKPPATRPPLFSDVETHQKAKKNDLKKGNFPLHKKKAKEAEETDAETERREDEMGL